MRFTKLGAMALIENENDLFLINGQIVFTFHQIIQFLNCSDDNPVVILLYIPFQAGRAFRPVDTIRREPLVFFHRLIVKILAVNDKEYLVNKVQLGCQSCCFETGKRFSRACGMPDISTTFGCRPFFCLVCTSDFP